MKHNLPLFSLWLPVSCIYFSLSTYSAVFFLEGRIFLSSLHLSLGCKCDWLVSHSVGILKGLHVMDRKTSLVVLEAQRTIHKIN